jgi:hypothetical protein
MPATCLDLVKARHSVPWIAKVARARTGRIAALTSGAIIERRLGAAERVCKRGPAAGDVPAGPRASLVQELLTSNYCCE